MKTKYDSRIIILRGLPASGKSTFANKWLSESISTRMIINWDSLKLSLNKYNIIEKNIHKIIEKNTIKLIDDFLKISKNFQVCIDNTNLNPDTLNRYLEYAKKEGYSYEIVSFMHVPLKECIYRDSERQNKVGKKVIMNFFKMYEKELNIAAGKDKYFSIDKDNVLPPCYIFDIDGVLACNLTGRGWFNDKDMINDSINEPVFQVLKSLHKNGFRIVISTGRNDSEFTRKWLNENLIFKNNMNIPYDIYFRSNGDYCSSGELKQKNLDLIKQRYNVCGAFDDEEECVSMYKENNILCFKL